MTRPAGAIDWADEDRAALAEARRLLESPGLAIRLTNLLGKPIEKGFDMLPDRWQGTVMKATNRALEIALHAALTSMRRPGVLEAEAEHRARPRLHKAAATLSGAAGGAFGMMALALELPVSTTILCRTIADIARENGEDLSSPAVQMACLEVFALGGPAASDDAGETGYFAIRTALARAVSQAAEYVATNAVTSESAPALVRLLALIAARFKVQVSQKAAAMAVPVIGAAGGAAVNYLFIDHFQAMSRGHFTIRRLERRYGEAAVRAAYLSLGR